MFRHPQRSDLWSDVVFIADWKKLPDPHAGTLKNDVLAFVREKGPTVLVLVSYSADVGLNGMFN